jgi:hypothetical protein
MRQTRGEDPIEYHSEGLQKLPYGSGWKDAQIKNSGAADVLNAIAHQIFKAAGNSQSFKKESQSICFHI